MMKIAGHTNTYHTYPLDEALEGIRRAGFRYVELSAIPGWTEHVDVRMDSSKTAELRKRLEKLGLEPVALSCHADLTTDAGIEHTLRAMRWTSAMRIPILNTAIGGHAGREEDEQAFLARVGRVAQDAERLGITVTLETHGDCMATGVRSAALLARVNRPSIRLGYDTANVRYYGGVEGVGDLERSMSWISHVHLKDHIGGPNDWNFPALGRGEIDFRSIFGALGAHGYDGPASVELEFQGEPWPSLEEVNAAMATSFEFLHRLGVA